MAWEIRPLVLPKTTLLNISTFPSCAMKRKSKYERDARERRRRRRRRRRAKEKGRSECIIKWRKKWMWSMMHHEYVVYTERKSKDRAIPTLIFRHNRKKMRFKANESIETNKNNVCIVYLSETIALYFFPCLSAYDPALLDHTNHACTFIRSRVTHTSGTIHFLTFSRRSGVSCF